MLSTASQPELTDLVTRVFLKTPNMIPQTAEPLFIKEQFPAGSGATKRYTEIDVQTFAKVKREGQATAKAQVQIGYYKDLVLFRYGMEIDITWEERRRNKYTEVMANILNLSHFCPQRKELNLNHVFTFADATSYTNMDGDVIDTTGGDSLALISSAHTLLASSATWSNVITGNPAFSQGGVEAAEQLMVDNILSHFGERRYMEFNKILSGPDATTCNNIKRFLKSTTDVTQNNPGVMNTYQNKYEHVVLYHLATDAQGMPDNTKSKRWFVASTGKGPLGWQCYYVEEEASTLKAPNPNGSGDDFSTDNWTYGTRMSDGIVRVTGRGLMMSTGTGSS